MNERCCLSNSMWALAFEFTSLFRAQFCHVVGTDCDCIQTKVAPLHSTGVQRQHESGVCSENISELTETFTGEQIFQIGFSAGQSKHCAWYDCD